MRRFAVVLAVVALSVPLAVYAQGAPSAVVPSAPTPAPPLPGVTLKGIGVLSVPDFLKQQALAGDEDRPLGTAGEQTAVTGNRMQRAVRDAQILRERFDASERWLRTYRDARVVRRR